MDRLRTWIAAAALMLPAAAIGAEYRLYVDGLACPFCAYGIEKQLGKLDGVEDVHVEVGNGLVRVVTRGDRELRETDVREAVERAGFTLDRFDPVKAGS